MMNTLLHSIVAGFGLAASAFCTLVILRLCDRKGRAREKEDALFREAHNRHCIRSSAAHEQSAAALARIAAHLEK